MAERTPEEMVDEVDRRQQLTTHYAQGAAAYHRLWAPMIGTLSRRLLEQLPLGDAHRVVDLGSGTGYLLGYLRRAAPEAMVIGGDLTLGMLRQAVPPPRTHLAVMDARQLALSDGCADAVVAPFMLFHLLDPGQGLSEVRRILQPDGWFGMVSWGIRRRPPVEAAVVEVLDRAGAPTDSSGQAGSDHLQDSPEKAVTLLRNAGFVEQRAWIEQLDYCWDSEQLADSLIDRSYARRLAGVADGRRERLAGEIRELVVAASSVDRTDTSQAVVAVARRGYVRRD